MRFPFLLGFGLFKQFSFCCHLENLSKSEIWHLLAYTCNIQSYFSVVTAC